MKISKIDLVFNKFCWFVKIQHILYSLISKLKHWKDLKDLNYACTNKYICNRRKRVNKVHFLRCRKCISVRLRKILVTTPTFQKCVSLNALFVYQSLSESFHAYPWPTRKKKYSMLRTYVRVHQLNQAR